MSKERLDPKFKKHFLKLMENAGLEDRHFYKRERAGRNTIPRATLNRIKRGQRPSAETASKLAKILRCGVSELLNPGSRETLDWLREDVKSFLGMSDVDGINAVAIDSAILLHRGPQINEREQAWLNDAVIRLEIDDRPVAREELADFYGLIDEWAQKNPGEKRGIKYCVTALDAQTAESGGEMVIHVRPVEFHLFKPFCDYLAESYHRCPKVGSHRGAAESPDECPYAAFRRRHFPRLLNRDRPLQPNVLCAHLLAVSKDGQVILLKRRLTGVGYSKGCWSASCEEHLNADWRKYIDPEDIFPPSSVTDFSIFAAFRRALREELKLSEEDAKIADIKVLGVGMEFENLVVTVTGIARLPLTAAEVISNPALLSNEEHDSLAACPFDIYSLLPVLRSRETPPLRLRPARRNPDAAWEWHPTSRMRIYLGLIDEFGEKVVNEALRRR